jgi:hypothetical protein
MKKKIQLYSSEEVSLPESCTKMALFAPNHIVLAGKMHATAIHFIIYRVYITDEEDL